jgi:hypothetical protein
MKLSGRCRKVGFDETKIDDHFKERTKSLKLLRLRPRARSSQVRALHAGQTVESEERTEGTNRTKAAKVSKRCSFFIRDHLVIRDTAVELTYEQLQSTFRRGNLVSSAKTSFTLLIWIQTRRSFDIFTLWTFQRDRRSLSTSIELNWSA